MRNGAPDHPRYIRRRGRQNERDNAKHRQRGNGQFTLRADNEVATPLIAEVKLHRATEGRSDGDGATGRIFRRSDDRNHFLPGYAAHKRNRGAREHSRCQKNRNKYRKQTSHDLLYLWELWQAKRPSLTLRKGLIHPKGLEPLTFWTATRRSIRTELRVQTMRRGWRRKEKYTAEPTPCQERRRFSGSPSQNPQLNTVFVPRSRLDTRAVTHFKIRRRTRSILQK